MGLFTKDIKTMDDLFVHTLQDIYYADQQILKALPKMIDKATNSELKAAFQHHLGAKPWSCDAARRSVQDGMVPRSRVLPAPQSTESSRKQMSWLEKSRTRRCLMRRCWPPRRR